jgi:hypothetical protein
MRAGGRLPLFDLIYEGAAIVMPRRSGNSGRTVGAATPRLGGRGTTHLFGRVPMVNMRSRRLNQKSGRQGGMRSASAPRPKWAKHSW